MSNVMKYRGQRRPADSTVEFEHRLEVVYARVRNVSREGARLDGDFNFAAPDVLTLLHGGKRFEAKIAWMRFGSVGIRFFEPLDRTTYAALLGISVGASHGPDKRQKFGSGRF